MSMLYFLPSDSMVLILLALVYVLATWGPLGWAQVGEYQGFDVA